jgi:hypothetical protein
VRWLVWRSWKWKFHFRNHLVHGLVVAGCKKLIHCFCKLLIFQCFFEFRGMQIPVSAARKM